MSSGKKSKAKEPLEPLSLDEKRKIAEILAQEKYPEAVSMIETSKKILTSITPTARIAYKQLKIQKECDKMYARIKRDNMSVVYHEIFKDIYDHMTTFTFCPIELDRRRPNFYHDPDNEIFKRLGIFVVVFDYFSGGVFLPTEIIDMKNIYLQRWRHVITIGRDGTTNGKTNEINFFECLYIAFRQYFANRELFIPVPAPYPFIAPPRSTIFTLQPPPPIPHLPFTIGGQKKPNKNQTKRNRKLKK